MPDSDTRALESWAEPLEGWQRVAGWARAWAGRHPVLVRGLGVVRRVWLWGLLAWLLVLLVIRPSVRESVAVCVQVFWLLIVWFWLARTKTVSWRLVAGLYAIAQTWAIVVGLALWHLSHGLVDAGGVRGLGPSVAVAGIGEESLKLVPVAVLALLAPGRVRRFAVVDWLLVGLASGLGFQAVEELGRRLAIHVLRPGLFDVLNGDDRGPGSGYPQYGWSPFGGWSNGAPGVQFPGHHVTTAAVTTTIGLAVAAWRRAHRGPARAGLAWRITGPVVVVWMWWVMVAVHAGGNATSDVGDAWLTSPHPSVPWPLRITWQLTDHGFRLRWLLPALLFAALLIDARHLSAFAHRRTAHQARALPPGDNAATPTASRTISGTISGATPHPPTTPAPLLGRAGGTVRVAARAVLASAHALGALVAREVVLVLAAHARQPGEPRQTALRRGRAAVAMLRATREDALAQRLLPPAGRVIGVGTDLADVAQPSVRVHTRAATRAGTRIGARIGARSVVRGVRAGRGLAVAGLVFITVTAFVLAPALARHIGLSETLPTHSLPPVTPRPDDLLAWLAGLLDSLATWWAGLPPSEKILFGAGLAALITFSGGTFTLGLGLSGVGTYLADHGHGAATFLRHPIRATADYLTHATPADLLTDTAEAVLTFAPGNVAGAVAGRGIRLEVEEFVRDPQAWRVARRVVAGDDAGTVYLDASGMKRPPTWAEVVQNWREGRAFNQAQWHRFEANEIKLTNGKVLDSYNHGLEIVSRKNTQLAALEPSTAARYLDELTSKYNVGEIVADTPRARASFPHLVGKKLRGRLTLEVPVQSKPIPQDILDYASSHKITIKDITGHVYP